MSIGMTAAEFWDGDPWLAAAYRESARISNQRKSEEMWLQGLYFYNALSTALSNAFSKKGTRPAKYTEEPIRVVPYTEREREAIAERERQKAIEYFNRVAKKWGKVSSATVPSAK